ncbi:helix-turn-helix transcriptional regulator [Paludibacterium purpuratum]|uniref:Transcriptional regulator n=1 Tax=Paludibacterium purpuratum TaxID=1144873 RepID=A0A4R7BAE7_9NEIS|nr:YafY family protein [Paludibacterium purpuratum]TDR81563.1 transcriptional regulator [Paludibacterium purpuratum]
MSQSTTRVFALLELMQSHGLMSGPELARRLDVDPRTLRRYIQTLESLGIPVMAERGRDGGYRLMQGFKLPPMMFTNEEAIALGLGLVASRHLGLNSSTQAGNSALSKIERVMPENLKKQLRALGATVSLDLAKATSSNDGEVLALLSGAARDQQAVELGYRTPNQPQSERWVDPYGLAFLGGSWYLIGFCHLRQTIRTFRLDRIATARPVARHFAKPSDFDPLAYLTRAFAGIERTHRIRVHLYADLSRARAAIFAAFGLLEERDNGTQLLIQADDLEWVARELARLPFAFEIEEPLALRAILARHARSLLVSLGEAEEN